MSACSAAAPESTTRACQPHSRQVCASRSRTSGWSSTIKTRKPAAMYGSTASSVCCAGVFASNQTGSVRQNSVPKPSALCTSNCPCISVASRLLIASPRPLPPYKRLVDALAWVKLLKISAWVSSVMPMPVSRTRNSKTACKGSDTVACGKRRTDSTISPVCVNLTALLTRLSKICCRRKASPNIASGMSAGTSSTGSIALWPTPTPITEAVVLSSSCKENGASSRCNSLASILEKSRMSSIRVFKTWADNFTLPT